MSSVIIEQTVSHYSTLELCERLSVKPELVAQYVELGVIKPEHMEDKNWRFSVGTYLRLRKALRLQQDLDINLPGIALALDLLDEINSLKEEIEHLKHITFSKID